MAPSSMNLRLGRALRQRRKRLGLSQIQLSDLAGVGPVFLHAVEHGKPTIRLDKLLAVLEILGMSLELKEGDRALLVDLDPVEEPK